MDAVTTPQRMCAGCRERAAKDALVRLVWDGETSVVVDLHQRLPGRGVYLHPACAARALKSRAIGRGLRRNLDGREVGNVLATLPVG